MPNAPIPGGRNTPLNGGVSTPQIFKSTNPATHVFIALLLQTAGIVIAVTVAGLDDSVANLILVAMVGLLLLFMIMNVDQFKGITNILTNAETGATA